MLADVFFFQFGPISLGCQDDIGWLNFVLKACIVSLETIFCAKDWKKKKTQNTSILLNVWISFSITSASKCFILIIMWRYIKDQF